MRAVVLFALAACHGTNVDTETGAGGPTGLWPVPSLPECAGPGPNCVDHAMWSDACAADPAPIDSDVVVYEGPIGGLTDHGPSVEVITDEPTWTALLDGATPTRAVDFDLEQVVVVRNDIAATCGARLSTDGLGSDGTIRLSIEDSSGACEAVCQAVATIGAAFAVPVGEPPAVCLAIVNTCQP